MKIAFVCPNCNTRVFVSVTLCANCERTSDVYYPAPPGSKYAGQLLCPSCYGSPGVSTRKLGPVETKI